MKKAILLAIFLILINSFSTILLAQEIYRSKDFEQQGVSEYIGIVYQTDVYYWTNVNTDNIRLEQKDFKGRNTSSYKVHFPNSQAIYQLDKKRGGLLCIHPDGKEQSFEKLPTTFRSQDFERKGVIEYIQWNSDGSFHYFTNLQKENKIPLEVVSSSNAYPLKVKFPNGTAIYEFTIERGSFGSLFCTHPDERKQTFAYYRWDKELK